MPDNEPRSTIIVPPTPLPVPGVTESPTMLLLLAALGAAVTQAVAYGWLAAGLGQQVCSIAGIVTPFAVLGYDAIVRLAHAKAIAGRPPLLTQNTFGAVPSIAQLDTPGVGEAYALILLDDEGRRLKITVSDIEKEAASATGAPLQALLQGKADGLIAVFLRAQRGTSAGTDVAAPSTAAPAAPGSLQPVV